MVIVIMGKIKNIILEMANEYEEEIKELKNEQL